MIPIANHLWQSSLFALAAALLTYALRGNRARIRYWLWLAASVKFLLPFSLLMSLGETVPWRPDTTPAPARAAAAAAVQAAEFFLPLTPTPEGQPLLPAAVWFAGFAVTLWAWSRRWRVVADARRAATPAGIAAPIPVLLTPSSIEPGIVGIFRPVLLLPHGILKQLPQEQFDAIVAHELCHVRRRDNLAALVHMLVESIFWFHPLVWWIGARLVDERERACDQEVLEQGNRPEVYAEGILNVCGYCVQSPLPCASGVTGADLKGRIREIMSARPTGGLTLGRKALLAGASLAALGMPLFIGVVRAQGPLTFDIVSIRPADPQEQNRRINFAPGGGLNISNIPVHELIQFAYGLRPTQVIGGPGWITNAGYNITARLEKPENTASFEKLTEAERSGLENRQRARTQALLLERFQLKIRRETRELPVLALTVAKGGLKITPAPEGDSRPRNMRVGRGTMTAQQMPMAALANGLSRLLSQSVIDQTGLPGAFDFTLEWSPDASPEADGPSIYTALQEKLGLRLESKKAPVEVIVIESVERPSEN